MKRRTFLGAAALASVGSVIANEKTKTKMKTRRADASPAPDTIEEQPRSVAVVQDCDVCVLGGSCTGVFAAVRAAQMGATVALVEKQNAFGGVATSGLVATWPHFKDRKFNRTIIGGLSQTMIDRLSRLGATSVRSYDKSWKINTEELKIELDKLVLDHASITPYLHTYYAGPLVEGGKTKAVFIENKDGRQAIRAKVFIDATGDGDLSKDIGIPFVIREGLQPPSTCAKIHGLPGIHSIFKLMKEHGKEFGLARDHGWSMDIPGGGGVNMYALTHVFNTNACDARQLTAAEMEGRRQIRAYMDIARKYGGDRNNPSLLALSSYIGVRETRSFEANYTLTEEDVMSCRRFPDAIANCEYHIDVHDPETGEFKFTEPHGEFYQIPLATMLNEKADNVVMAGRMISTDRAAFGGIRVMPNMNQVGEAAGVTAALAASEGEIVSRVDPASVRKHLARLGAVII